MPYINKLTNDDDGSGRRVKMYRSLVANLENWALGLHHEPLSPLNLETTLDSDYGLLSKKNLLLRELNLLQQMNAMLPKIKPKRSYCKVQVQVHVQLA
ncbi:uncharacterized protein DS421_3g60620 [Arachis hypogaea]|nr:uncharacterized protein DS421_3g60620 [Arachis hypogaea]